MRTLVILGLAYILFVHGLGNVSLWDPDEPRQALMAREMIDRSDYVHPYLNGLPVSGEAAPLSLAHHPHLQDHRQGRRVLIAAAFGAGRNPVAPSHLFSGQKARSRGVRLSLGPNPRDELSVSRQMRRNPSWI